MSPNTRLMGKGHGGRRWDPFTDGNANHPAGTSTTVEESKEFLGQFTRVLSNRALNDMRGGYAKFLLSNWNLTNWSRTSNRRSRKGSEDRGFASRDSRFLVTQTIPGRAFRKCTTCAMTSPISFHGSRPARPEGGRRVSLLSRADTEPPQRQHDHRCGRVPPPANLPAILPDWEDADTWNLNALNRDIRRITIGVGDFNVDFNQNRVALWVQDDWKVSDALTLNLGLRYDVTTNGFANDAAFPPFVEAGRPDDTNNIQPRLGFAYQLNDRTVLRGGSGIYFGDAISPDVNWMYGNVQIATIQIQNDGRADFATNPFNGRPLPTYDQAQQLFCHVNPCLWLPAGGGPGTCATARIRAPVTLVAKLFRRSSDCSVTTSRVEADYVYSHVINEKQVQQNINLTYNQATGANNPFSNRALRAYPAWGAVSMSFHQGLSNYHGLQMALTKRFRNRWQGSGTYTLSTLQESEGLPHSGVTQVNFPVAADLGDDYSLAVTDQRHRLVFNGIWDIGYAFQLSGLYFFGSGERYETSYGGDLRDIGADASNRLRPDGSIVPRNSFAGDAIHRVDLRLQRRFRFGNRMAADGIVEVHNLFNHANYGTYITEESNTTQYLQPDVNANIAYGPRVLTFGFRFTF